MDYQTWLWPEKWIWFDIQTVGPALHAFGTASQCHQLEVERVIVIFKTDLLTPATALRIKGL